MAAGQRGGLEALWVALAVVSAFAATVVFLSERQPRRRVARGIAAEDPAQLNASVWTAEGEGGASLRLRPMWIDRERQAFEAQTWQTRFGLPAGEPYLFEVPAGALADSPEALRALRIETTTGGLEPLELLLAGVFGDGGEVPPPWGVLFKAQRVGSGDEALHRILLWGSLQADEELRIVAPDVLAGRSLVRT